MTDDELTPIFERAYNVVLGYAYKREGEDYRAQELTHQVMERAWKGRHAFRGTTVGEFVQLCKVILSREWADNPYKRKPEHIPMQLNEHHQMPFIDTDPTALIELEEINHLMRRIPTPHREALVMHRILGYSLAETAEELGGTEAAVSKRAYNGHKKLEELLYG